MCLPAMPGCRDAESVFSVKCGGKGPGRDAEPAFSVKCRRKWVDLTPRKNE